MVAGIAYRKGLELVLDVDPYIPDGIVGDCVRIRQIMLNILNNAVKVDSIDNYVRLLTLFQFTDRGYIQVSVGGKKLPTDNWEFLFSVKDTGCGIPPGSEQKLFQMFSQLDGSTTRKVN